MLKLLALLSIATVMNLPAIATPIASTEAELNFDDGDLICFMQATDGRVLNLAVICGSNARNGAPLPNSAIVSNSSLGGLAAYQRPANAPPCFVFDAQGQPCPIAQSGFENRSKK
ncbi:MAG: hypothetical protein HC895_21505 [Leptolyngbyaceae cyanobacterium SM1_3_5]|nr:hypothetical protein [Leptolyngbyaceae cyanobacterium SM1_3_5]